MATLVDDIINTAGTVSYAADGLIEHGYKRVITCATHTVLSGNVMNNVEKSAIESLVFSDTIQLMDQKKT